MSNCKINGLWCAEDCPFLKPYGPEGAITARCEKMNIELTWYDFWNAVCQFWWCPTCEIGIDGSEVTFEEKHDERCGGCGELVERPKV